MSTVKLRLVTALAAAALAAPMAASAALVTQLIHFDDASNGWKWYSDKDNNFLFNPTNLSSSASCADPAITGPGVGTNGTCVLESNNGPLPKMTRPEFGPNVDGSPSQGSSNKDPEVSGDNLLFTLDAFYFQFDGLGGNGNGNNSSLPAGANVLTVEGSNGKTFTFKLGSTYSGPITTGPVITFYEGSNAGNPAGALAEQIGYVVSFGELFKDVTWIQFTGAETAQTRVDCVVATFDGTTTEPHKGFDKGEFCGIGTNGGGGGGGGGGGNAPEPASLALVGLGLLGAAVARRRRSR